MMRDVRSHRWALVIGHPGHELRAFHFLETATPLVSVLTDGSGAHGRSRLADTTALLISAGATRAPVYGGFADADAYAHLMAGDGAPFVTAAEQLSICFADHGISAVLTDAAEGYNPVHDLCRIIAETSVSLCGLRAPCLYEMDLIGPPDGGGRGIRLQLDEPAFARKLEAVRRYPVLRAEAAAAFERHGTEAFRTEFLRQSTAAVLSPCDYVPYYEQVGNERVQQGRYRSVLRYSEHVRPVLARLLTLASAQNIPARPQ
jgi:hypothetical protein